MAEKKSKWKKPGLLQRTMKYYAKKWGKPRGYHPRGFSKSPQILDSAGRPVAKSWYDFFHKFETEIRKEFSSQLTAVPSRQPRSPKPPKPPKQEPPAVRAEQRAREIGGEKPLTPRLVPRLRRVRIVLPTTAKPGRNPTSVISRLLETERSLRESGEKIQETFRRSADELREIIRLISGTAL